MKEDRQERKKKITMGYAQPIDKMKILLWIVLYYEMYICRHKKKFLTLQNNVKIWILKLSINLTKKNKFFYTAISMILYSITILC